MKTPVLLAPLLGALALCPAFAQEQNPAFKTRVAGREAAAKLDWQIAVAAYTFRHFTFFETIDRVAALGIEQVEGFNFQKIGSDIPGTLNPLNMSADDLRKVRDKLEKSGVRLVALYYGSFPTDEAQCRAVFEKSKQLGVKYFVSEPKPELLPMLDKLAQEYDMIVGLHGHDKKSSPTTWHPELVAKQCQPFSSAIGAFSDTGHWIRSGLNPSEGVEILKDRIVGFEIHDLHASDATGNDVPLGTGVGRLSQMLEAVARVKTGPVLLSIECSFNPEDPSDGVRKSIEFLDGQARRLAGTKP